ncbi:hypothetical protein OY671_002976 [Metschnikowia pulcherrima]|nr:hypothetical protein OY671_002976 [Metschnikowia pulcherrima]
MSGQKPLEISDEDLTNYGSTVHDAIEKGYKVPGSFLGGDNWDVLQDFCQILEDRLMWEKTSAIPTAEEMCIVAQNFVMTLEQKGNLALLIISQDKEMFNKYYPGMRYRELFEGTADLIALGLLRKYPYLSKSCKVSNYPNKYLIGKVIEVAVDFANRYKY